jgi:hypothetical protein
MAGFYSDSQKGKTQLRVAMVEPKELIDKMPNILSSLYKTYIKEEQDSFLLPD